MLLDRTTVWHRAGIGAGIALSVWIAVTAPVKSQSGTAPTYAPNGELLAPVGFETWVFVGSNLGLAYRQGQPAMTALEARRAEAPQFHNVYISPEAYAAFRATGEFPVPTVLVMEKFAAADKEPRGIVAGGVFNGDRVGVEVAVKNLPRPDHSMTAWAYYDLTDPSDPSKLRPSPAFADADCESCHRQHASKDNVWVQFYPTLRKLIR
jgi:hypothetical protein